MGPKRLLPRSTRRPPARERMKARDAENFPRRSTFPAAFSANNGSSETDSRSELLTVSLGIFGPSLRGVVLQDSGAAAKRSLERPSQSVNPLRADILENMHEMMTLRFGRRSGRVSASKRRPNQTYIHRLTIPYMVELSDFANHACVICHNFCTS